MLLNCGVENLKHPLTASGEIQSSLSLVLNQLLVLHWSTDVPEAELQHLCPQARVDQASDAGRIIKVGKEHKDKDRMDESPNLSDAELLVKLWRAHDVVPVCAAL